MSLDREPGQQKFRTICEVHREMYQQLMHVTPDRRAPLMVLLRLAFVYGKKMTNKLRQYNKGYDKGWWEKHRLDGGELEEPQPELED